MTTQSERNQLINKIRSLPNMIEKLVTELTSEQLTTHFLTNEWTVAQNVHHLADSHMNSYIRCKLIATEEQPTLKPYDQDLWAAFPDAQKADISGSLALLKVLHGRWVEFWESLPADAWQRTGFHPERGTVTLDSQLQLYADHGEAHIDQITRTLAARL
ncbi:MAG: DinB family protein [Caldilineaceae bacterium]